MGADTKVIQISELIGSQWPVRLCWVGSVSRRERKTPMVTAYFVPYVGKTRSRANILLARNYRFDLMVRVDLSSGLTPDLQIGGFWTAGFQDAYPQFEQATFSVNTAMATTQPLQSYPGLDLAAVMIATDHDQLPVDLGRSHVATFFTPDGTTLIIACQELFRFYYGTSAKMSVGFLDGTFLSERWKFINAKDTIDPNSSGMAILRLGLWADNEDRVTLARVRFSRVALVEAEQLIPRAVRHSSDQRFPVIIRPPFHGDTTFVVRGRWVTIRGRRAFFAYLLESCTGPLPFLDLKWYRQTPPRRKRKPPVHDTRPAFAGSVRRVGERLTGESYTVDQDDDPSDGDSPLKLVSKLRPDRLKAHYSDEELEYEEIRFHRASVRTIKALSSDRLSIGTGRKGSDHRAVAPTLSPDREMSDRLTNFHAAIAMLPSISSVVRILRQDVYEIGSLAPGAPLERRRGWAFMGTRPPAPRIPRRAAVAIVHTDTSMLVLIEIEPRITTPFNGRPDMLSLPILRVPHSQVPESDEVQAILDTLIDVSGSVTNKRWQLCQFGTWFHARVSHVHNEPAHRYAHRILQHL